MTTPECEMCGWTLGPDESGPRCPMCAKFMEAWEPLRIRIARGDSAREHELGFLLQAVTLGAKAWRIAGFADGVKHAILAVDQAERKAAGQ